MKNVLFALLLTMPLEAADVPSYLLRRAESPVRIDGALDEAAWTNAERVELDVETSPRENVAAAVKTECYLLHDAASFYVGCKAFDPEPQKIRAQLSDRDKVSRDDYISVTIDTFGDGRRGYQFWINPLGIQNDALRNDTGVGTPVDATWDAIWEAGAQITKDGYVIEAAIPFAALHTRRGTTHQLWGIQLTRIYPREYRYVLSDTPRDRARNCTLCQYARISGFTIDPAYNLEVAPTVTAARTDARSRFPNGSLQSGSVNSEVGVSARWALTRSIAMSGTINPDFSHVEADVAQLNVNTQFSLSYPEKRPFFMESSDFFETPFTAVYTRNVAEPEWGVRLTGKEGKNAFAGFVASDEVTNILLPGSQSSQIVQTPGSTTNGVFRYRRDVGKTSTIGALFTGRTGEGYQSGLLALDASLRFTKTDSVTLHFLGSRTDYPSSFSRFRQPVDAFTGTARLLNYNHTRRNWRAYAGYLDVDRTFRADLGYMPRVDHRTWRAGGERIWWNDRKNRRFPRVSVGVDWDDSESQSGEKLYDTLQTWLSADGPRQSTFFLVTGKRTRAYGGKIFDETYHGVTVSAQPSTSFSGSMSVRFGDDIDFTHARAASSLLLTPSVSTVFGEHLSMTLSHTLQRLRVTDEPLFTANLSQLRTVYHFNARTFVRAVLQYTDIDRNPALYASRVHRNSGQLLSQMLFSYKLNPRTVVLLGYSDGRLADDSVDLTLTDRTWFLKLGYAWIL